MIVATALVDASEASPSVVEDAVGEALARAGIERAHGVLLFATTDFRKIAAQSLRVASKIASCLQISGGTVAGLADERRWVFDRPAVAAMVFGEGIGMGLASAESASASCDGLELAIAGTPNFPPDWSTAAPGGPTPRLGSLYSEPMLDAPLPVWANGRILPECQARIRISGPRARVVCSAGVRLLGSVRRIDACSGFDLQSIDGHPAADTLRRDLPGELHGEPHGNRPAPPLPLHILNLAVIADDAAANSPPRLLPLMSVNAEGSVTIGDRLRPGERVQWAIRQAVFSETDMRHTVSALLSTSSPPAFALYASCIGRGPYFYGGDERDWQVLREQLPNVPFLGIYGSGQMATLAKRPRLMQNSCVLAIAGTP